MRKNIYQVVDRYQKNWIKIFPSKKACHDWIMEGIAGCDGAERDHYVNMMIDFDAGKTTLFYN